MTEFWIDQACSGAYVDVPNEDVVGYLLRGDGLLIWAIDGASPLSDQPFTVFPDESNSGWFARRLSECLKVEFNQRAFDTSALAQIIGELKREFDERSEGAAAEWSWPVAAAVLVEISEFEGQVEMKVYRYADCFFNVVQDDLGADVMARKITAEPACFNTWKPASGFCGAKLEALRTRRVQQQRNVDTSALTINSGSAMNATVISFSVGRPLHVLVGSDGLARLWEVYRELEVTEAMSIVATAGVARLVARLRQFEASPGRARSDVKPMDDACGIHVFMPALRSG
ncbi:TPA: hypothetical protein ACKQCJ_004345 [Stenotrophomonas maltophilia]